MQFIMYEYTKIMSNKSLIARKSSSEAGAKLRIQKKEWIVGLGSQYGNSTTELTDAIFTILTP